MVAFSFTSMQRGSKRSFAGASKASKSIALPLGHAPPSTGFSTSPNSIGRMAMTASTLDLGSQKRPGFALSYDAVGVGGVIRASYHRAYLRLLVTWLG
jgi:hypothetical protein